jgi:hypothetical protein
MNVIIVVVVVTIMVTLCYFLSGISNMAGTIFEKKSTVTKKK